MNILLDFLDFVQKYFTHGKSGVALSLLPVDFIKSNQQTRNLVKLKYKKYNYYGGSRKSPKRVGIFFKNKN